jgi:hypothetical protein
MGYSTQAITVARAIRLAKRGCITSWDEGLPRRVVPSKVVRAELGDNDHVYLYYHNPQSYYGYRGKGDNELMQDVDLSCKRR